MNRRGGLKALGVALAGLAASLLRPSSAIAEYGEDSIQLAANGLMRTSLPLALVGLEVQNPSSEPASFAIEVDGLHVMGGDVAPYSLWHWYGWEGAAPAGSGVRFKAPQGRGIVCRAAVTYL